ncbi:MAG: HAD family hydrolase [Alphaproteobacteria bacterium]
MGVALKAISFDLWDTLIHDDSDEPKRRARGLPSKRDERRRLVHVALDRIQPIPPATVNLAYDVADAAFNKVWKDHAITWRIEERLAVVLKGLGRELPTRAFDAVVRAHQEMELTISPDVVDGAAAALAALHGRYRMVVVSDAIVSPGWALRKLLDNHGIARYFDAFAFSDEIGHAKPHPDMFHHVSRAVGVPLDQFVHIGDREHNDIEGPRALGMKAVLFVATRATDRAGTTADAVCERYADLPAIIDRLAG